MKARFSAALLVALVAAACGGVVSPSNNIIENFPLPGLTDTIPVGGVSKFWTYTVSNVGEYTVTVTSMNPPPSGWFGVFVGLVDGSGQCSTVFYQTYYAYVGTAAAYGPISWKGTYCVYIWDTGYSFAAPETYNIRVSHP